MALSPNIPPGSLHMLILKSLARLGSMHGYGIALFLEQMSEGVLDVEEGSLYPALQRLLLKGWVRAEWKQTENNRRARYYTLTADGKKALVEEMAAFDRVNRAITLIIHPTEA
ncbi:MAG TPA: PadR family transcriptional regulator [Bryobacteraceae bacterium]|nr:PadR family transcriptional regulator [Bryobacteraceae bacterium]